MAAAIPQKSTRDRSVSSRGVSHPSKLRSCLYTDRILYLIQVHGCIVLFVACSSNHNKWFLFICFDSSPNDRTTDRPLPGWLNTVWVQLLSSTLAGPRQSDVLWERVCSAGIRFTSAIVIVVAAASIIHSPAEELYQYHLRCDYGWTPNDRTTLCHRLQAVSRRWWTKGRWRERMYKTQWIHSGIPYFLAAAADVDDDGLGSIHRPLDLS